MSGNLIVMKITEERIKEKVRIMGGTFHGPTLSSTHFTVKYDFSCALGHQWKSNIQNIMSGRWCLTCSGRKKLDISQLQEYANQNGGKLITSVYSNVESKYVWECNVGHRWSAKATNVLHGKTWCPDCSPSKKKSIDLLQSTAALKGGEIIDTVYKGMLESYRWKCAKGHQWTSNANNVVNHGHWCRKCVIQKQSQGQLTLFESIKERFPDAILGAKGLFPKRNKLELDIWIPSRRVGIEYDGSYWHKSALVQERDAYKNQEAPILGITLFRVDDRNFQANPTKTTLDLLENIYLQQILTPC